MWERKVPGRAVGDLGGSAEGFEAFVPEFGVMAAELEKLGGGIFRDFDQPEIDEGAVVDVDSVATDDEGLELRRNVRRERFAEGGGLVAIDDELDGVGGAGVGRVEPADSGAAGGGISAVDEGKMTEADEDLAVEVGTEDAADVVVVVEDAAGEVDGAAVGVDGEFFGEFQ